MNTDKSAHGHPLGGRGEDDKAGTGTSTVSGPDDNRHIGALDELSNPNGFGDVTPLRGKYDRLAGYVDHVYAEKFQKLLVVPGTNCSSHEQPQARRVIAPVERISDREAVIHRPSEASTREQEERRQN